MVIGIDASRAESTHKTGVERYSFELIRALRATKPASAKVVLYSRTPLPQELGPFGEDWKNEVLGWPPKQFWTQIRLSWEMFRRPTDVLFVPSHVLPRIIARRTVTTIHDASFLADPKSYLWKQRTMLAWALGDAIRRASAIVVPSQSAKNQISGLHPEHVAVIPHGVRIPEFEHRAGVLEELGVVPGKYFLFVGRIERKKNLRVVIDAFAKWLGEGDREEWKMILVGGFGFGAHKVVAYAQNSGAISQIQFVGKMGDQQMFALLKGAAASLHPCGVEGFGMPVLESMAVGTPVIAAKDGAVSEVAGDAGLVADTSSPQEWVLKMDEAIRPEVRERLIAAGSERTKNFTWEKSARETWKVLLG